MLFNKRGNQQFIHSLLISSSSDVSGRGVRCGTDYELPHIPSSSRSKLVDEKKNSSSQFNLCAMYRAQGATDHHSTILSKNIRWARSSKPVNQNWVRAKNSAAKSPHEKKTHTCSTDSSQERKQINTAQTSRKTPGRRLPNQSVRSNLGEVGRKLSSK